MSSIIVPYVPTPLSVVRGMLRLAGAGPGDIVYDLGCGDGRVLVIAVKEFGVKKAIGIEIREALYQKALQNIRMHNIEGRARVIRGDFFEVDISEATVVTMFLLTIVNDRLKPKLEKELRPGARVVSHEFSIPRWRPKKIEHVYDDNNLSHTIYLYVMGEHR